MMIKSIVPIVALIALSSCDANDNPLAYQSETHSRGKVTVYIEESYKPLFETSIYVFESQFQNAHIKPVYATEQQVIKAFMEKKSKAIFMSRDFTKEEKKALLRNQVEVRSDKIAADAVALIVHPSNVDTTMSVPYLTKILKGEIDHWNTSKQRIDIVFDNENSANFKYMRELTDNAPIPANVFAVKSNAEVIKYVKEHPNAIGIIGVNWISDNDDEVVLDFLKGISVVGLSKKEKGECFKPYQAYIYTKEYPLTRELWSINKSSRQSLYSGLILFLTGEQGQLIIGKSNLVPANSPIRVLEFRSE
jgi:phosphate transport system substrate-binding protein